MAHRVALTALFLSPLCVALPRVSTKLPDIVDYVIAGGGATGLPLGVRLSEDPSKTVVVLEAGESGIGNPNITDLRLNRGNFGTSNDWRFVTVPQVDVGNRVQEQIQARVLGGGSAINSGMYMRGNKIEYDALETLGATGWNWDSMFSAVKKSEHFFPPTAEETRSLNLTFNPDFHGSSGPVALSIQALNISRFFPEFAIPTLRALGHDVNPDPNGGMHNGASWDFLTALPDTSTRSYAVSGYYLPVANRTNLIVMTNSHVSRVLWAPGKTKDGLLTATGVEYLDLKEDGGLTPKTIHARNIIISGSALNTPKILELSGVGDSDVLQSVGIETKINLPGVGANLCNQPITTASYLVKNGTVDAGNAIRSAILNVQPFDKYLSPIDLERSRKMLSVPPAGLSEPQFKLMKHIIENTNVPQMEFAWNIAADSNNVSTLTFDRIILLRPLSRGFVHINSTNPLDPPIIDPRYLNSPHDKFVFAKAVEYTRKIVNTEPLKSVIDGPVVPGSTVQTEADFVNDVNMRSVSEHHFVGTAAMTPRSQGGVVGPSLIVYGTSNVRIADLSIIASIPGIHTVSLAYMVAERAAKIIKDSHRV